MKIKKIHTDDIKDVFEYEDELGNKKIVQFPIIQGMTEMEVESYLKSPNEEN